MTGNFLNVTYNPSPTLAQFHSDNSFVRGVMGPIGSGKSVGMCWEIFTRAMEQRPGPDGWRRSRWAVIRNNYPELTSTTIKTWLDWFPESRFGKMSWGSPIQHSIVFDDVFLEVIFMPLDKPDDVKKLLSLDLTGAWINEARELPKPVIDGATGRVGRYPKTNPETGEGPSWSGVIMDTNPPDDSHWWYRLAEEENPTGWRFFRQPGGLRRKEGGGFEINPRAENIRHLPDGYGYYQRLLAGKDENWIEAYVLANYATILDGKAIYAGQWNDRLHVAENGLTPIRGRDVILGWDYGLTPACIIGQVTLRGQVRILEEIIGENCGIRQFAQDFVLPVLKMKYAENSWVSVGDPAGAQRSQSDERTVFETLRDLGIPTRPAPTNTPLKRWEAVRHFLGQLRDGEPAFLLDPSCKLLRKGFNGGYRFRRMQVAGAEQRFAEVADKNIYSHCHDSLQYLCSYLRPDETQRQADKQQPSWREKLLRNQGIQSARAGSGL
jgi:hypothetical protein